MGSSDFSGPLVGAQTILSVVLDNECDPPNPFVISLHCKRLNFTWERVTPGNWNGDKWVHGSYIFSDLKIE